MSRKTTWHSPDGQTHNLIDYILTPQRFKSSIIKTITRTYPGATINSDHDLVLCNIKMKLYLKKKERNNRIRYYLEKLRNPQSANEYKEKLELFLSQINKDENNVTNIVSDIEKAIHITAETIIGKYRRKKQSWITNDILDLCDKRRVLNTLKKNNSDIKEEYREINISIRKQMKNAKENWIQEQCNAINEDMARGRSNKRAYQILKTLTNPIKRKTMIIEDEN